MGFGDDFSNLVDAFFTILLELLRERFTAIFDILDVFQMIGG